MNNFDNYEDAFKYLNRFPYPCKAPFRAKIVHNENGKYYPFLVIWQFCLISDGGALRIIGPSLCSDAIRIMVRVDKFESIKNDESNMSDLLSLIVHNDYESIEKWRTLGN